MADSIELSEFFSNKSIRIFDTINEAVMIIDKNMDIVFTNSYLRKFLGESQPGFAGKAFNREFFLFVNPEGERVSEEDNPVFLVLKDGKEKNFLGFVKSSDGNVHACDFQVFGLLDESNSETEVVVIMFSESDSYDLKRENEILKKNSLIDEITGVYNRRHLMDFLDSRIEEYRRYGSEFGVILMKMDNLDKLKIKYGPENTDKILETVAGTIEASSRKSDLVARYSEDSFMIVAVKSNENKLMTIASRYLNLAGKLHVSVTMGITEFRKEDDIDSLFKRIEKFVAEAGHNGGNSYKTDVKDVD